MKTLSDRETKLLIVEMETLCNPITWDIWFNEKDGDRLATVEFPLGEIMNPRIEGFIWAWKMKGLLAPRDIESKDRFNAQGLEGKIVINTTLTTALLVYRDLPDHRCQIKIG